MKARKELIKNEFNPFIKFGNTSNVEKAYSFKGAKTIDKISLTPSNNTNIIDTSLSEKENGELFYVGCIEDL